MTTVAPASCRLSGGRLVLGAASKTPAGQPPRRQRYRRRQIPFDKYGSSNMVRATLNNRATLLNREASWLKFNGRGLEEAGDLRNPLLERVKFLALLASNLDEFFEVRGGGLLQQLEDGHNRPPTRTSKN